MEEFKNIDELNVAIAQKVAKFTHDPLGFVLWAFPWDSDPSLQLVKLQEPWKSKYHLEYGPDEWACKMLDEIGAQTKKNAFDGRHAVKAVRVAVSSGHGIGKFHDKNLIVDTPDGIKRWGDLRVGDRLWGPDGKPTLIVDIPFDGTRPGYRVTFDDGSSTIVGREHLWTVQGRQQRRYGKDEWITLETHEILERGLYRKNGAAQAKQWRIPLHKPVQYQRADLPLDPYVLGVLIGDGCFGKGLVITTSGEEIFERISKIYPTSKRYEYTDRNAYEIRIYDKNKALSELGLLSHRVWEKFVPRIYKESSVEQRLELLRGLIDTDGEVNKHGSVIYSTSSQELAQDILWLVRSLGGKASQQKTKIPFFIHKGERKVGRPSYRLTISMPPGVQVCYVKHKLERIHAERESRYLTRWISNIEPVGDIEGMCVSVDREDGLYLANDFIVTHNSAMTAWLVCWLMSTRSGCHGTITANTSDQLASKTWAQIATWSKKLVNAHWFEVRTGKGSMRMQATEDPTDWFCTAQTCREENSESFAGQHAAGSSSWYIFDEASAVPSVIWEVAEGGLTDGEPFFFAFGNPTRNSGNFFECFNRLRHRWTTYRVDSRDVQITNKESIQAWAEDYGDDSDFFRIRVKGEFPRTSSAQFISTEKVQEAMSRPSQDFHPGTHKIAVVGADIAMYGDDRTCFVTRVGKEVIDIKVYQQRGLEICTFLEEHVNWLYRHFGFQKVYIFVDGGGVGAAHVDLMHKQGWNDVVGINFGASADNKNEYRYKCDEIWGRMKHWIEQEEAVLPKNDDLLTDLTAREFTYTLSNQIRMEPKETMKKRGLSSPDIADALALTFSQVVYEPPEFAGLDNHFANQARASRGRRIWS